MLAQTRSLNLYRSDLQACLPAGKSSVLAALLGELQPTLQRGSSASPVAVRGSMAYCAQVPWIASGTVKVGAALACA
jgi:hypothetical protein